jgi:hypothetical protein
VQNLSVTPSVSPQCILVGDSHQITVETVTRSGITYTVTGNGTDSVTVRASATSSDVDVNLPSGWTRNADGSVTTTLTPNSDGVVCVAGESSEITTPPTTTSKAAVAPPTSIKVLPSSHDEGHIAYTGVNVFGMGALALLLLGAGALLIGFGRTNRRRQREH